MLIITRCLLMMSQREKLLSENLMNCVSTTISYLSVRNANIYAWYQGFARMDTRLDGSHRAAVTERIAGIRGGRLAAYMKPCKGLVAKSAKDMFIGVEGI